MTSFHPDRHPASFGPHSEDIPRPVLTSISIVVAALAGALVAMGIVLVVLGAELVTPEPWMLGLVAVATVIAWGLVLALPVKPSSTDSGQVGSGPTNSLAPRVQATVMLRVALLEAPALLGFALAVLSAPVNLLVYALPAAFSLLGIWLFARPRVVLDRLSRAA